MSHERSQHDSAVKDALPTVLVVDDDEMDRLQISTILEVAGFGVLEAKSGQEALGTFMEEAIKLVVTDIVMTDGDGVSLIAWLHSLNPRMPVVAISGKGDVGLSAALGIGARAAFEKPVNPENLVTMVERLVEAPGSSRAGPHTR